MTPERRPYIAANWKLWGTRAEASDYCARFRDLLPEPAAEVALCVPFTTLDTCVEALAGSPVKVAAQNMHAEEKGA